LQRPGPRWTISQRGLAALRYLKSAAGSPAAARAAQAAISDACPSVNLTESPLAWLRVRKDKAGVRLITEAQFEAGERLRSDLWHAQMTPRITTNWSGLRDGSQRLGPHMHGSAALRDSAATAGERVRRALAAVGPELSGILVDVCGHLKGLEEAERAAGWPQRSGKVVLQLALTALARHYGLIGQAAARGGVRQWGASNYRPTLEAWR
jgi:hypothetical protein